MNGCMRISSTIDKNYYGHILQIISVLYLAFFMYIKRKKKKFDNKSYNPLPSIDTAHQKEREESLIDKKVHKRESGGNGMLFFGFARTDKGTRLLFLVAFLFYL